MPTPKFAVSSELTLAGAPRRAAFPGPCRARGDRRPAPGPSTNYDGRAIPTVPSGAARKESGRSQDKRGSGVVRRRSASRPRRRRAQSVTKLSAVPPASQAAALPAAASSLAIIMRSIFHRDADHTHSLPSLSSIHSHTRTTTYKPQHAHTHTRNAHTPTRPDTRTPRHAGLEKDSPALQCYQAKGGCHCARQRDFLARVKRREPWSRC